MTERVSDERLRELVELVGKATGPLPDDIAIELWGMSAGCRVLAVKGWAKGEAGYRVAILLVEGFARQTIHVPEWQFPDRRIDATLGLVKQVLPNWKWHLWSGGIFGDQQPSCTLLEPDFAKLSRDGKPYAHAKGSHVTLPLAILAALLTALSQEPAHDL
jgi:hypothetical protein